MTSPTVRLLSGGAAQGLVEALAPGFTADTGCAIEGSYGAVGAMRERLLAGAATDLVILSEALVAGLIADGLVRDPLHVVGRVETAIAVPAGSAVPPVGTGEALRRALLAAEAVYCPDPAKATAGIHFAKVLDELGIAGRLVPRLRPHPNGHAAMKALAAGGARAIGCTQVTEILATPGVCLAGALPPPHGLATAYAVALTTTAAQPDLATRFMSRLTGADAAPLRRRLGFI